MTRPIRTTRAASLAAALFALTLASTVVAANDAVAAGTAGEVTVTVRYTGKGPVDESHRIWVWLFNTPQIGPGSIPIYEASTARNGDAVVMRGLTDERVWIAVAYDERGGFAGQAPPPAGSPIAIHGAADNPASVVTADNPKVDIRFDDSFRMQD